MGEMSTVVPIKDNEANALENLILGGDLSRLTSEQKTAYYMRVCNSVGLNPFTKPFDFMKFQGREILYANKGCAEQLRAVHGISIEEIKTEKIADLYVVVAKARGKDGRTDSSIGAVSVAGLKGEAMANAMMKAETKAKRRVSLSMCGLGNMPDESEIEDMQAGAAQTKAKALDAQVTAPLEIKAVEPVSSPRPGDFQIKFGKLSGRFVKDLSFEELEQSISYWNDRATRERKPLSGMVKDGVDAMVAYLSELETQGE